MCNPIFGSSYGVQKELGKTLLFPRNHRGGISPPPHVEEVVSEPAWNRVKMIWKLFGQLVDIIDFGTILSFNLTRYLNKSCRTACLEQNVIFTPLSIPLSYVLFGRTVLPSFVLFGGTKIHHNKFQRFLLILKKE